MTTAVRSKQLFNGKLSIERRKSPRVVIEWAVSYKKISLSEITHGSADVGQVIQAWCRDVSKSGMCLVCPAPVAVGDVLALDFEIEDPPRGVELFAKVSWSSQDEQGAWRAGIEFMSGDDGDAEHLMIFFTEKFGQGYEPI